MQSSPSKDFIPAAGRDWLLPFYDPLNWLIGAERIKTRLVESAGISKGDRVLDLGCGTGDLALLAKRRHPDARVFAIDPDPKALARARAKAQRVGVEIKFEQGFAGELPWPDGSFERVLSSLMLHHLTREEKLAALRDVARVLAPGGTLHVLDFGPPTGRLDRALTHILHHDDRVADNLAGALPELIEQAGFTQVRELERPRTLLGALAIHSAQR